MTDTNFAEAAYDTTEYEYAGFWIRVAATLIDTVIITLVFGIFGLLFDLMGFWDANAYLARASDPNAPWYSTEDLMGSVFQLAVSVFFWVKFAGTPGKRLLKLKVLDEKTGKHLTVNQAVLRYIAYFVSIFVLFIGFIWVAFDKKKQGWHDKIAKTVVVKEI